MKIGLDDYFAAGHTAEELLTFASRELRPAAEDLYLPTIIATNRDLRDISDDTIQALQLANDPPVIYQQGNILTRIAINDDTGARLEHFDNHRLLARMARVANFRKLGRN
ncbi:MAG TPA: hypothetical protein VLX11_04405 [Candidatus Acidoferrales bacterium]|nr:hypothetical protein [Candidatus Acidoferrales bacterium]